MRHLFLLFPLFLAACASSPSGNGNVLVETASRGQALQGAQCTARTGNGNWTVMTPGSVPVGSARGDLRIICNKPGYRTSEVVYQPSRPTNSNLGIGVGGGGGNLGVGVGLGIPVSLGSGNYPARVIVEMNPG